MSSTRSQKTQAAVELGEKLRQARVARRLSVVQVAHELHMPRHHIEALEAGDLGVFAAEIYARGACLKYASYVGLGTESLERVVWRAVSAGRERVPLKIHMTFSWVERLLTPRVILWAVAGGVGLIVIGYIIWQVQTFLQLPDLELIQSLPTTTTSDTIVIEGKAEAEAKVTVNGEVVLPDKTTSLFRVPLMLHSGVNVVRIEAENAAGRKAIIEHHVIFSQQK
jgi:cytoskeletal protein RodZ